jgi:hypothetical protein
MERRDNAITVTVGDIAATISSSDSSGNPVPLDPDGNVRLNPGDGIKIKMSGFDPGTSFEAWLFSTPTLLGRAEVGWDGTIDVDFIIPDSIPAGAHRIALKGTTADKKDATIGLGVMVGDWHSESNVSTWLIVVPVCAAIFGAMLLPAVTRRRRR